MKRTGLQEYSSDDAYNRKNDQRDIPRSQEHVVGIDADSCFLLPATVSWCLITLMPPHIWLLLAFGVGLVLLPVALLWSLLSSCPFPLAVIVLDMRRETYCNGDQQFRDFHRLLFALILALGYYCPGLVIHTDRCKAFKCLGGSRIETSCWLGIRKACATPSETSPVQSLEGPPGEAYYFKPNQQIAIALVTLL